MQGSYSWKVTMLKGIKYFVAFGLPVLLGSLVEWFPGVAQRTVGTAALMLLNYLKVALGMKIV